MLVDEISVIKDLVDAFAAHGIKVDPADICESKKPKRIHAEGDAPRSKNAWFVLHLDDRPAGTFGHHSKYPDESFPFRFKGDLAPQTPEQRRARLDKQARDKAAKAEERRVSAQRAARKAIEILSGAKPYVAAEHAVLNGYLARKGIVDACGALVGDFPVYDPSSKSSTVIQNAILIPIRDIDGNVWSVQAIFPNADNVLERDRTYLAGGDKLGKFFTIGAPKQVDGADVLVVCEGFATGVAIHRATGHAVRVAFDAGSLEPVATVLRDANPDAILVIAGDNDRWKDPVRNPGLNAAFEAAAAVGGMPVWPPFMADAGELDAAGKLRGPTDFDDMVRVDGDAEMRRIFDAVLAQVVSFRREARAVIEKAKRDALREGFQAFTNTADLLSSGIGDLPKFAFKDHLLKLQAWAFNWVKDHPGGDHSDAAQQRGAAEYVAKLAMKRLRTFPVHMDVDTFIDAMRGTGAPLHESTLGAVRRMLNWMVSNAKDSARARVGISPATYENGRHEYQELDALPTLTPDDYRGVLLFRAPMGSGKTQTIGKPFATWALAQDVNQRMMAIVHRRSLVRMLAKDLSLEHYEGMSIKDAFEVSGLAVCLPSITVGTYKQIADECRFLFIDEIAQVLEFLASTECKTPSVKGTREHVYLKLRDLVRNATCIIGCDAGLNDRVIKFLEACRPDGEPFRIFDVKPKDEGFRVKFCHSKAGADQLYAEVETRLERGENLWIACESKTHTKRMEKFLKKQCEGTKFIRIDRDTANFPAQKRFLADPEGESRKYNVVIHSPTISSGISVEHKRKDAKGNFVLDEKGNHIVDRHFHHCMFIGGGHAITPADSLQMVRRVRYIETWTVATVINNKSEGLQDADDMGEAQVGLSVRDRRPAVRTKFSNYCNEVDAQAAQAKAMYSSELFWLFEKARFTIERPDEMDPRADSGLLREMQGEITEEERAGILAAPDLTKEEADLVRESAIKCEDDRLALLRYTIKHFLGGNIFEWLDGAGEHLVWDAWRDGYGIYLWDRFLAARDGVVSGLDFGLNIEDRQFKVGRVRCIEILLGGIDFKPRPMVEFEFMGLALKREPALMVTQQAAREMVERITDNDNRLQFVAAGIVPGRFGRKIAKGKQFPMPKHPMGDVVDVLARFGLKLERHVTHSGDYVVDEASLAFARACADRRRSAMNGEHVVEPAAPPTVAPATVPALAKAMMERGGLGFSTKVVIATKLADAMNEVLPADQQVHARALTAVLEGMGMVRHGDGRRLFWKGAQHRAWIVGGDDSGVADDVVTTLLDETIPEESGGLVTSALPVSFIIKNHSKCVSDYKPETQSQKGCARSGDAEKSFLADAREFTQKLVRAADDLTVPEAVDSINDLLAMACQEDREAQEYAAGW